MKDSVVFLFIVFLAFAIGGAVGEHGGELAVRQEAIKHHAAYYVITNEPTGEVEFRWNK